MSVVINSNYAATVAANNLAASSTMLQKSLNRLSSGSKIVTPADDAGGLAVAMKLSAAAKRQGAVGTNIGNAVSYLQTQDGVLKVTGEVLDRIGELRTLYVDPTKNAQDKANYDAEFAELQKQLSALTQEKFNSVVLFGTNSLTIPVTDDGNTTSAVTIAARDLSSTGTGKRGDDAGDERRGAKPPRICVRVADRQQGQHGAGLQPHHGCGRGRGKHATGALEHPRAIRHVDAHPGQPERADRAEVAPVIRLIFARWMRPPGCIRRGQVTAVVGLIFPRGTRLSGCGRREEN